MTLRILLLGDIVARSGLEAVERHVPALREELDLDLVVANGENVTDGVGITERHGRRLLAAGIDCLTLGNHTWRQKGVGLFLDGCEQVVRPANLLERLPGRGLAVVPARDGTPVAVANLLGRMTLDPARSPFEVVDELIERARAAAPVVLLDMHAEATSEKVAMGWHLAGRATAVVGTHTHVQTNDARVLPGGTAYVTDLGMTGPHDGVIGSRKDEILRRFLTQLPQRAQPADGDVRLEGLLVTCRAEDGRATAAELFRREA